MHNNRLAAVPDTSMITLSRALVRFLLAEAELRGWGDVSERLKAVEAALDSRAPGT
ncbi:hypothetical protein [Aestuariivirga litoralis]|uniref:hypothetical protein n=1 Tax=Aestuariivirga litoralis TaxID=2650924 RepID=UPI00137965EB|nr:hypothetical protein [Aestuariivirga litoralis]